MELKRDFFTWICRNGIHFNRTNMELKRNNKDFQALKPFLF